MPPIEKTRKLSEDPQIVEMRPLSAYLVTTHHENHVSNSRIDVRLSAKLILVAAWRQSWNQDQNFSHIGLRDSLSASKHTSKANCTGYTLPNKKNDMLNAAENLLHKLPQCVVLRYAFRSTFFLFAFWRPLQKSLIGWSGMVTKCYEPLIVKNSRLCIVLYLPARCLLSISVGCSEGPARLIKAFFEVSREMRSRSV